MFTTYLGPIIPVTVPEMAEPEILLRILRLFWPRGCCTVRHILENVSICATFEEMGCESWVA